VLVRGAQRAGVVGVERQVEPAVAADRHGPVLARRRRAAELDARAVGQRRAEQRVLAVDALVADAGDLLGEALDQLVVDLRRGDPPHSRLLGVLDPDLARAVDDDLGHRVAVEPLAERREVGVEVDAPARRERQVLGVVWTGGELVDLGAHRDARAAAPG